MDSAGASGAGTAPVSCTDEVLTFTVAPCAGALTMPVVNVAAMNVQPTNRRVSRGRSDILSSKRLGPRTDHAAISGNFAQRTGRSSARCGTGGREVSPRAARRAQNSAAPTPARAHRALRALTEATARDKWCGPRVRSATDRAHRISSIRQSQLRAPAGPGNDRFLTRAAAAAIVQAGTFGCR